MNNNKKRFFFASQALKQQRSWIIQKTQQWKSTREWRFQKGKPDLVQIRIVSGLIFFPNKNLRLKLKRSRRDRWMPIIIFQMTVIFWPRVHEVVVRKKASWKKGLLKVFDLVFFWKRTRGWKKCFAFYHNRVQTTSYKQTSQKTSKKHKLLLERNSNFRFYIILFFLKWSFLSR